MASCPKLLDVPWPHIDSASHINFYTLTIAHNVAYASIKRSLKLISSPDCVWRTQLDVVFAFHEVLKQRK